MRALAVLAACAASGCAGVDDAARCWAVSATDGGDVALRDGDPVQIVAGPDHQFMVVVGVKAEHIEAGDAQDPVNPDNPQYKVQLLQQGWGELASRGGKLGFQPVGEGASELSGIRLIFGWTLPPAAVGATCQLKLSVVDHKGDYCSQNVSVVLQKSGP